MKLVKLSGKPVNLEYFSHTINDHGQLFAVMSKGAMIPIDYYEREYLNSLCAEIKKG